MEDPFCLPSIIKHSCEEEYFCAAVSNDGKTIAMGTDEYIALFPTYSPSLPSCILKYTAKVDKYRGSIQRVSCKLKGGCRICGYFPVLVRGNRNSHKAIIHMAFFGDDDEYLLVLGNGTVTLYDLNLATCEAIICFCFDVNLEITGKICFTPINVERYKVKSMITRKPQLSCVDFIINDRPNRINYYKIIFNEEERWWYLDCRTAVNLMSNINDVGMKTLAEVSPADESSSHEDFEYVPSRNYMEMEGVSNCSDQKERLSFSGAYVEESNCSHASSSKQDNRSWDGSEIAKAANKSNTLQSEECKGDMSDNKASQRDMKLGEPYHKKVTSEMGNKSDGQLPKTHTSSSKDAVNQNTPNFGASGTSIEQGFMQSSSYVLEEHQSKPELDAPKSRLNSYESAKGHVKQADGLNSSVKGGESKYSSSDMTLKTDELHRLDTDAGKRKHVGRTAKCLIRNSGGIGSFDLDVDERSQLAESSEVDAETKRTHGYLVYCILSKAFTSKEVSRKVVLVYPIIDVDEDNNDDDENDLEDQKVIIEYEREILVAIAYRIGYLGIFKAKMNYTAVTSTKSGRVIVSSFQQPVLEFVLNVQFRNAIHVDNILYSGTDKGHIAILGGDDTIVLRYFIPEVSYNFKEAQMRDGKVKISSDTALENVRLSVALKHNEKTTNAIYRIGCFVFCDNQCILFTNASTGLKIFGTRLDANGSHLRMSILYESHARFADMVLINNTMSVLILMDDGTYAINAPMCHKQWHGLVPNFIRIHQNIEYVECEEEFDKEEDVQDTYIEGEIDYNKMEETLEYKFFYTAQYALFGNASCYGDSQIECSSHPLVHSSDVIKDYEGRLCFE